MYEQVLEAIAIFASHGNSGGSAPIEINLVNKLCNFDIITPLRFTDDEWVLINGDGTYQNKRKYSVFKNPDGSIHYNEAFVARITDSYSFTSKVWSKLEHPTCWHAGLFEHKNNILTGRYFNTCFLRQDEINNGWMPKPTRTINCSEVEIAPDNWIMAVDSNDADMFILSCDYDIQWKNCPCMKGIRLEDVTPELVKKAFEEIKNNK